MSDVILDDHQTRRYSRHILLPDIDLEGQSQLLNAKVLIIGAGGLGCPAGIYLAASGVGHITIADFDHVELSNLQRQIAFKTKHIGHAKAETLKSTLTELNPDITAISLNTRMTGNALQTAAAEADAVIDASDNFETRFAVNAACHRAKTPLISGAASRYRGQLCVFDFRQPNTPCYNCLFSHDSNDDAQTDCQALGVFAPVTGIIGSYLAAETIKVLLDIGDSLTGRLATFDIHEMSARITGARRDPRCPTCGAIAPS